MRIPKFFKEIDEKLSIYKRIALALLFLAPLATTCIKNVKPYMGFVKAGPDLVKDVAELKSGLLVTTAASFANMGNVDSTIYTIDWKGHKYRGRLKVSKSGNIYVSVRDGEIGEQAFAAVYDYEWFTWYFIDFDGNRVDLKEK